jgi:hypothetical protein
MFLFYSQHCPHSRMLLETIKRYDGNGLVKLICIESLQAAGRVLPPQVHSVPALMIPATKEFLFGKQVFDYLLLPGRGKLFVSAPAAQAVGSAPSQDAGPTAFSFAGTVSDSFTNISDPSTGVLEGSGHGYEDRTYAWSTIQDTAVETNPVEGAMPFQEETRARKESVDLDSIRMQRDMDVSSVFGTKPRPM